MKEVSLKNFAVVNGAVRYASEGPITVSDDEAKRLEAADLLDDDKAKSRTKRAEPAGE